MKNSIAVGSPSSEWAIPNQLSPNWLVLSKAGAHTLLLCDGEPRGAALINGKVVARNDSVSRPVGTPANSARFAFESSSPEGSFAHVGRKRWGPFKNAGVRGRGEPFIHRLGGGNTYSVLFRGEVIKQVAGETFTPIGWILFIKQGRSTFARCGKKRYGPFPVVPRVEGVDGRTPVFRVSQRGVDKVYRGDELVWSGKRLHRAAIRGKHIALAISTTDNRWGPVKVSLDGTELLECKLRKDLHLLPKTESQGVRCVFACEANQSSGFFDGTRLVSGFSYSDGPWIDEGNIAWLTDGNSPKGSRLHLAGRKIPLPTYPDYERGDEFGFVGDDFVCVCRRNDDSYICATGRSANKWGPFWLSGDLVRSSGGWAALVSPSFESKALFALHSGVVRGPFPFGEAWSVRHAIDAEGTLTVTAACPDNQRVVRSWRFEA